MEIVSFTTKENTPESLHGNTDIALLCPWVQPLDSTAKEKIAAEPMGATKIFSFTVKTISCTLSRISM